MRGRERMMVSLKKEYKQMELFNPLIYMSKHIYMVYASCYRPWQEWRDKKMLEPFLVRNREIEEERKGKEDE